MVSNVVLVKQSFDKYIVNPANKFGLGGFIFDISTETETRMDADITDHYVEDNSTIQDHIGIRPLTVRLSGYVGELVYRPESDEITTAEKVIQKLTILSEYLPNLITSAKKLRETGTENFDFEQTLDELENLWKATKDLNPNATEQQKAYLYFKALYEKRILIGLQTPHEYLKNMAIQTVVARQSEETDTVSDFEIVLKQIRFAGTETVSFDKKKYRGRTGKQASPEVNKGKTQGKKTSILVDIFDGVF